MKKFSSTMKANSRRTSQTKRRIGQIVITGGVLLAAWYAIPRVLLFVAALVVYPITATQTWLLESSASLPQFLRQRSELIEDLNAYEQRVAELGATNYTIQSLRAENDSLRALLGVSKDEHILAGIIGRPNLLPYDVVVLDKGTVNGVQEGAPVYVNGNVIVGFVSEVSERSSVVTMITSPHFKATVYVIGPDIYTLAEGIGGGQLRIGVPQGIPLTLGDMVVVPTASVGVYGSISHIESEPTKPEQYAYVSPDIPLASLRKLTVGLTPLAGTSFEDAQKNVAAVKTSLFEIPVPDTLLASTSTVIDTASTTEAE